MASPNHIGRGLLLNKSASVGAETSSVFQDGKGASKTVVSCFCSEASTGATGLKIELEDPTTENETTFTAIEHSTTDVLAATLTRVVIDGAAGSRLRCTITPDVTPAVIKIWVHSAY